LCLLHTVEVLDMEQAPVQQTARAVHSSPAVGRSWPVRVGRSQYRECHAKMWGSVTVATHSDRRTVVVVVMQRMAAAVVLTTATAVVVEQL
jgi:hypothetical protein